MGYTHDVNMSQWLFANEAIKTAGTWTPTLASNVLSEVRTAADASFTIYIPIKIPSNSKALKGAYLKTIDVYYKILTAAADDFATVELEKMIAPLDTVIPTGSAPAITMDTAHDTAAERKAVQEHKMTVTLTTPVWVDDDHYYVLTLIVDAAATTVFTLYGARANYTLRV